MKKILTLIMVFVLIVLGMSACNKKETAPTDAEAPIAETVEELSEESTEAAVEETAE